MIEQNNLLPAANIIEICGGVASVAVITGKNESRVRRWKYSKEKGGTGGVIPHDSAEKLLDAALRNKWPLSPEHFFNATSVEPS